MTRRLITTLATALLHQQTLTLVVEPALADLEFEATGESPAIAQRAALRAAWLALLLALWHDLVWDPRGPAWKSDVAMLAALGAMMAAYHAAMLTLILGLAGHFPSRELAALAGSLPSGTIAAALVVVVGMGVRWVAGSTFRVAHDVS